MKVSGVCGHNNIDMHTVVDEHDFDSVVSCMLEICVNGGVSENPGGQNKAQDREYQRSY